MYDCPQSDWFKFKTCTIKTCKNYTEETVSKCLGIDRIKPEGSKVISDAEIHMFKFRKAGITTRLVQIKRKEAIERIRFILVLQRFVSWIKATYTSGAVFTLDALLDAEDVFPLKIRRLGWENWMWEYFIDEDVWVEFCKKAGIKPSEVNQGQLLFMKASRYEKLVQALTVVDKK